MKSKKIVFVVGAGASNEFDLPVGEKLKSVIANLLDFNFQNDDGSTSGDSTIFQAMRFLSIDESEDFKEIDKFIDSALQIRNAMPQAISIDNFIDNNRGDKYLELSAKLAIVRSILDTERNSKLYNKSSGGPKFASLEETWINSFFQLLTENVTKDEIAERLKSIAFIDFNYDRCIEYYLYHSFQNFYNISHSSSVDLLEKLEIHHPYGTVGCLPWQKLTNSIEFGDKQNVNKIVSLSKEIKTFAEGLDSQSGQVEAIQNCMVSGTTIVFLGFAYHPLNMHLLIPQHFDDHIKDPLTIVGTAYRVSNNDCNEIKSFFINLSVDNNILVEINNTMTCYNLFHEFRRKLSFSEL